MGREERNTMSHTQISNCCSFKAVIFWFIWSCLCYCLISHLLFCLIDFWIQLPVGVLSGFSLSAITTNLFRFLFYWSPLLFFFLKSSGGITMLNCPVLKIGFNSKLLAFCNHEANTIVSSDVIKLHPYYWKFIIVPNYERKESCMWFGESGN